MQVVDLIKPLGIRRKVESQLQLIKLVREGITKQSLDRLAREMALSQAEIASVLTVSVRTLQRKNPADRLDPSISDRIIELARVHTRAVEVFEDTDLARQWLKTASDVLGSETPLQLLDTSEGIALVLAELDAIDYGTAA